MQHNGLGDSCSHFDRCHKVTQHASPMRDECVYDSEATEAIHRSTRLPF